MRISSLSILILLLLGVGAPPTAVGQVLPPGIPQIQFVAHDVRTPLAAGGRLTVRLRGTPGGVARFHVAGIAAGLGMREIPSGDRQAATYVGTYVVRPGEVAPVAAITASLRVGERELVRASDRPVTIDARPPEVLTRVPLPESRLTNLRPNIVLGFFDGGSSVNPAAVRLFVNGRDVTGRTAVTPAFATYVPEQPLQPGPVHIQALVGDRAGNVSRIEWSFTVAQPQGLINSVTVSSATGLRPGDYLTIVMAGVPAGRASMAIGGASQSIPMAESTRTPGTYVGTYPIGSKHQGALIQVTAQLRKGDVSSAETAIAAFPVMGLTPRPSAVRAQAALAADDQAIERIIVRGESRPGFHITALLSARMESGKGSASWTPLLATSAPTRSDGRWSLAMGPVVPWERASLFLTIVAVDPLGQRSPPTTLPVQWPQISQTADTAVTEGQGKTGQESPAAVPIPQPTSAQPTPVAQPTPATQPTPAPQPASGAPPAPSVSIPQPSPAPPPRKAPQCPPGQVVDPKTNQCVPTQSGDGRGNVSPAPPSAGQTTQPSDPTTEPKPGKPKEPKPSK